jgi:signal transduction histidine kinase
MVNSFSRATGLDVEVNWGNAPWSFGDDLNAAVYRLIQESMTNAFRHGRATKIQIRFWITDEKLLIVVHDNGRGANEVHPGIGLTGMTERLAPLGGRLVAAGGERGFSVRAEIPYGNKP